MQHVSTISVNIQLTLKISTILRLAHSFVSKEKFKIADLNCGAFEVKEIFV